MRQFFHKLQIISWFMQTNSVSNYSLIFQQIHSCLHWFLTLLAWDFKAMLSKMSCCWYKHIKATQRQISPKRNLHLIYPGKRYKKNQWCQLSKKIEIKILFQRKFREISFCSFFQVSVRIFNNLSTAQNLREINFGKFTVSKSTHFDRNF